MKTVFNLSILACLFLMACNNASQTSSTEEKQEELTEEVNIIGKEVAYATDSTTLKGYIAYNENAAEKAPGILIIHEWWGHNDYVRKRADMLAELGYVAFALDMYGEGQQADHPDDAGKFAGMVMSNLPEAKARFEAAMKVLKSNDKVDADKMAAIGYCFGGSVALSMANAGYDLDAVAAFHSGVQLPIPPSEDITGKVLVANGADDPFISAVSVEAYKAAMDKVGADYEYVAYEGVVHSFTNPDAEVLGGKFDLPTKYDEEADKDSWSKLQSLFESAFAM